MAEDRRLLRKDEMKYLSLCSGIEAASVAWTPLGWEPVAFSEIERFPCAVLRRHFPDVPNLGDVTKITGDMFYGSSAIDLLVGGTPCQGFSIAGARNGLHDERSALAWHYVRLVGEIKPRWIVWENVPGVLSTNKGADFRNFLQALIERGYSLCWRILDAQYFGVPQRRRRVFVVGHLGGRRAAEVLLEPESVRGDTSPCPDKKTKNTADPAESVARCLHTKPRNGYDLETYVLNGHVSGTLCASGAGTSRPSGQGNELSMIVNHAITIRGNWQVNMSPVFSTLTSQSYSAGQRGTPIILAIRPRRLTPLECERLQGFPDHYTALPGASDTARYKALGNSMAVPCMAWIGRRIARVDAKKQSRARRQP